jgi:RNA polymerase sigma factor (sigma-70 family)
MADETDLGGSGGRFLTTRWTTVLAARDPDAGDRRQALDRLIATYWKPVYFLIRRRGHPVEAAKDFTQGFFAAFLERDFLQYLDQGRGRFRLFLRTTLDHYLIDEHHRATAQKRGGGKHVLSLDFAQAESEVGGDLLSEDPDRLFRRKWAVAVMRQAIERLRAEYAAEKRAAEFDAFLPRLGGEGRQDASYADVARNLGISEVDVTNRLHRFRKRYREAILAELRLCTETDADAEEELRELFTSFSP